MRIRSFFVLLGLAAFSAAQAQTTFLLNPDWPFYRIMPTPEQIQEDPSLQVYADAVPAWLEENDVRIEYSSLGIWDQQALLTAIAGGTATTYYSAGVIGGWSDTGMRTAFAQGLAADTTEAVLEHGILDKLSESVRAAYDNTALDGRYYGLPDTVLSGLGVFYRKDLIEALGLQEPTPDWTWQDFAELAKGLTGEGRRGAILQPWAFDLMLNVGGAELLGRVPAPETSWNWRFDYTSNLDYLMPMIELGRRMLYEDRSVLSNPNTAPDDAVTSAFYRGEAAMFIQHSGFYMSPAGQGMNELAANVGKDLNEVVGWVRLPKAESGTFGPQVSLSLIAVNPDLSDEELSKAVGFYDFVRLSDLPDRRAQISWQERQSLRSVYGSPVSLDNTPRVPGIPGSFADAWGEDFARSVDAAINVPTPPTTATYLPPEVSPGPSGTALSDAMNRIFFTVGDVDVAAILREAEEIMNAQAQSFVSSVPDDQFIAGIRDYYAASAAFWQEHAPRFYEEVFAPWLEKNVEPVVGGPVLGGL